MVVSLCCEELLCTEQDQYLDAKSIYSYLYLYLHTADCDTALGHLSQQLPASFCLGPNGERH